MNLKQNNLFVCSYCSSSIRNMDFITSTCICQKSWISEEEFFLFYADMKIIGYYSNLSLIKVRLKETVYGEFGKELMRLDKLNFDNINSLIKYIDKYKNIY